MTDDDNSDTDNVQRNTLGGLWERSIAVVLGPAHRYIMYLYIYLYKVLVYLHEYFTCIFILFFGCICICCISSCICTVY